MRSCSILSVTLVAFFLNLLYLCPELHMHCPGTGTPTAAIHHHTPHSQHPPWPHTGGLLWMPLHNEHMTPNSCQTWLQDPFYKIQLPVLEFSIMKAWFNFPLMDYCTFIYVGAHMPRFWHSVIFMRSVWSSSPSLWHLTTQRSLASSENPVFSLHLTWQILHPSPFPSFEEDFQRPVISCDALLNFPADFAGNLGDNWFFSSF